jgi:hypothetical protein
MLPFYLASFLETKQLREGRKKGKRNKEAREEGKEEGRGKGREGINLG